MRYEIHVIEDEQCSGIKPKVLAATNDYNEAYKLASFHSNWIYGSGSAGHRNRRNRLRQWMGKRTTTASAIVKTDDVRL